MFHYVSLNPLSIVFVDLLDVSLSRRTLPLVFYCSPRYIHLHLGLSLKVRLYMLFISLVYYFFHLFNIIYSSLGCCWQMC